jgi:hypothetical protein
VFQTIENILTKKHDFATIYQQNAENVTKVLQKEVVMR